MHRSTVEKGAPSREYKIWTLSVVAMTLQILRRDRYRSAMPINLDETQHDLDATTHSERTLAA